MTIELPQGIVEITIARKFDGEELPRKVFVRYLTEELIGMLHRQNLDPSEVNCMKWPIFGLSRWATFKCILMKTDLYELLLVNPAIPSNQTFTANVSGFRIGMNVGSNVADHLYFNRMHLAKVEPLAFSSLGWRVSSVNYGEAMFLCTFHCGRWAARGTRVTEDDPTVGRGYNYYGQAMNPGLFASSYNAADHLTPKQLVTYGITTVLADPDFFPLYRTQANANVNFRADDYLNHTSGDTVTAYGVASKSRADYFRHKPTTVIIDEICAEAGVAVSYLPIQGTLQAVIPGDYAFSVVGVAAGLTRCNTWLSERVSDIVAGTITRPTAALEMTTVYALPNIVYLATQPKRVFQGIQSEIPIDGSVPSGVFNAEALAAGTPTANTGQFYRDDLLNPWSRSLLSKYEFDDATMLPVGDAGTAWLSTLRTSSIVDQRVNADAGGTPDLNFRWSDADVSGLCDVTLRSWALPVVSSLTSATGASWVGGTTAELRLQTDGNGFGYPTTRIYGTTDDWLVRAQEDNRQHEVEGSGLAKVWRGVDGRLVVHVTTPSPVTALIKIVSNTQEPALVGQPVWKYAAKIVRRDSAGGASLLKGEIDDVAGSESIIAYNLMETTNDLGFAGGYKLPLTQNGFSVLPIGEDRDGVLHDVVVPAILLMDRSNLALPAQAYFSAANAIDGSCSNPVNLLEDGGSF
jgi:hypothetical protein